MQMNYEEKSSVVELGVEGTVCRRYQEKEMNVEINGV